VLKGLARRFFKTQRDGGVEMSSKEVFERLKLNCDELHEQPQNETSEEKKNRKALRLFCRYASLGHPNRKGALLYADSITNLLNSTKLAAVIGH